MKLPACPGNRRKSMRYKMRQACKCAPPHAMRIPPPLNLSRLSMLAAACHPTPCSVYPPSACRLPPTL